jgi:hypothetical protein
MGRVAYFVLVDPVILFHPSNLLLVLFYGKNSSRKLTGFIGVRLNYGTIPNVSFPVAGHLYLLSKTFKINPVAGSDSLLFPLGAPTASLSCY